MKLYEAYFSESTIQKLTKVSKLSLSEVSQALQHVGFSNLTKIRKHLKEKQYKEVSNLLHSGLEKSKGTIQNEDDNPFTPERPGQGQYNAQTARNSSTQIAQATPTVTDPDVDEFGNEIDDAPVASVPAAPSGAKTTNPNYQYDPTTGQKLTNVKYDPVTGKKIEQGTLAKLAKGTYNVSKGALSKAGNVAKHLNSYVESSDSTNELNRIKTLAGIEETSSGGCTGAGAIASAPVSMGNIQKRTPTKSKTKTRKTK